MPLIIKKVTKTAAHAVVKRTHVQIPKNVAESDRKYKEVFIMPWIDRESCTACGICVDGCPVDAISMEMETVEINMAECIRCGICHDVCPTESVRHDSEQIPDLIEFNVEMTKRNMALCMKHLRDVKEKEKCLIRMKKYFNREKLIAERTLDALEMLTKGNRSGG